MRGKGVLFSTLYFRIRITPAYAGKSSLYTHFVSLLLDHPRLCGEKLKSMSNNATPEGSPPPMRGKDDLQKLFAVFFGITPAYAGKRAGYTPGTFYNWDHPRLCGEKVI